MPCTRRAPARVTMFAVLAAAIACAGDGGGVGTDTHASTLTVRIAPKADSLGVGQSRRFAAQVVDQTGVPRSATVAWISLNNTIATVSAGGDVTALAPGLVGIVATIGASADTASLYVRAGELVVEPNAVTTAVGEEIKLSVTTRSGAAASGAGIQWSSSDTTVARVTADGTVTAVGAGDATLMASAGTQQGSAVMSVRQKDIASLRLTPATSAVYPQETEQLQVTAYDDAGRTMALDGGTTKWSSSSSSVLTVDDGGNVTGMQKGSAVVTARIGSKSATATVNVLAQPAASVSVALDAATLEVGQATQAVATLKDAAGTTLTDRTVAWQSSNPAIATVNSSGVVTAVARGSATISAIADGKTGGATVTVAPKTVAAVVITPNPVSATVGQSAQLTAVAKDAAGSALAGRAITWSSSNAAVATVSSAGLVSAVSAGTVTISAAADGVTGQATFTSAAVTAATVVITPSSPHLQVGQDVQLTATASDAGGNLLTSRVPVWSSSNPTIATVSNSGRVTGVGKGNASITAALDGKASSVVIGVDDAPPAPVASVAVNLSSSSLNVGQSTQASVVLRDAAGNVLSGRAIAWSSAAPSLATVTGTGLVSAIAAGSATIVATSEGITGSATVVIAGGTAQPVATVTLSAISTSMFVGQSQAITVTLRDAQGNALTGRTIGWSSSNLAAVTVSPSGQVQAVGAGSATITATSEGKSGAIALTVTAAPVVPVSTVSVTGTATTLTVGQTTQLSATPRDGHGVALTGRTVTWSSSSPATASVSSTGVVTALAAGTVMINATIDGVVGSMALTISPVAGTVVSVRVTLTSSAVSLGQTTQASAVALDASGNTVSGGSASWTSSNSAVATVSASGVVSAVGAGQATISAVMSGKTGSASLSVSSTAGSGVAAILPELPRSAPTSAVPSASRVIPVAAGGDLQSALDAAQPGDELRLASGATWTGNFTIPSRPCSAVSGWITVRTDVDDSQLPATGTRITPTYASRLAKIVTNNTEAALRTTGSACGWRFLGLEIAGTSPMSVVNYGFVKLGDGGWAAGGDVQTSLDKVPQDFIIDRVFLHGLSTTNSARCLALNSGRTAIINSWLSDCHAKGFDSQAIEGWNGPGPYLIENNFLAGAGENVMFGGADPGISGLSPSDITIRRNHVYKDPSWKGVWTVKNLFELKNARRVLVEGNVFENSWADAQSGMAIVIKSTTDSCGTGCMWEGTTDVTLRYNIVRNANRGLNVQAYDNSYVPTGTDVHVQRVRAEHNLFENIGQSNGTTGDGWLALLTHDLTDVALVHNTFVGNLANAGIAVVMDYGGGATRRLQLENNVFAGQQEYAVFYSGTQVGTKSLQAMASDSWSFAGNIVTNVGRDLVAQHPAASWYPATTAEVGFAGAASGDYRLGAASAYRGKATDGRDPGADLDEVASRTAGVKLTAPFIASALRSHR